MKWKQTHKYRDETSDLKKGQNIGEREEREDVDEEEQSSSHKIKEPWYVIYSIRNMINNNVNAYGTELLD